MLRRITTQNAQDVSESLDKFLTRMLILLLISTLGVVGLLKLLMLDIGLKAIMAGLMFIAALATILYCSFWEGTTITEKANYTMSCLVSAI